LVPGGADIDVIEENLPAFLEAVLKYKMMGRYEGQLKELIFGLFEVIPAPLLAIFTFRELELLMCGLPYGENTQSIIKDLKH
jgi:hypothetical protein